MSQDPQLFEGTIRWNLCRESGQVSLRFNRVLTHPIGFNYCLVGAVHPDRVLQDALEEACEQACILDFIRGLKDGFETEIGMKGAALSGGQRQVRLGSISLSLRDPHLTMVRSPLSVFVSHEL